MKHLFGDVEGWFEQSLHVTMNFTETQRDSPCFDRHIPRWLQLRFTQPTKLKRIALFILFINYCFIALFMHLSADSPKAAG